MRPLSMKKWKKGLIERFYETVEREKMKERSHRVDL
jgi:hypothetical protein